MNYHGITKASVINGEGVRVVLWVAGCNHCCEGCQNAYTWDPDLGSMFTDEILNELVEYVQRPFIDGLTLSGGDPLFPSNRTEILKIAKTIKEKTHKSIWLYTGYLWEEIKNDPIINYVDVVVDGKYDRNRPSAKYRGSENQRIIRVKYYV